MEVPVNFDNWIKHIQPPGTEELLKEAAESKIISFAGGLPSETMFPTAQIQQAFQTVITGHAAEALQYTWSEGFEKLREQICEIMAAKGIKAVPAEILPTHGLQQGLDLICRLFIRAKEPVLIENPTYSAAINAFELQKVKFVPLERTEKGIDPEKVEKLVKKYHPGLFYLVPSGHNPVGNSLPESQQKEIIRIARENNMIIIEDAAYDDLEYDSNHKPLAAYPGTKNNVIYLGSFSKILSPGIRVGWIKAPKDIISKLALIKQASDLQTSSLGQMVLSAYLSNNSLAKHIGECRNFYKNQRDLMVQGLKENFPEEVSWTYPTAAFSVWLKFPKEFDSEALLKECMKYGTAFEPGKPYFTGRKQSNFARVSFSFLTDKEIKKGLKLMGDFFKEKIQKIN